jgi:hypothetical protein
MSLPPLARLGANRPKTIICAVCRKRCQGFGYADPWAKGWPAPTAWFCSKVCQRFYAAQARNPELMAVLSKHEADAIRATMKRIPDLIDRMGWEKRFADLSEQEAFDLIAEMVSGFQETMGEIAKTTDAEVPF